MPFCIITTQGNSQSIQHCTFKTNIPNKKPLKTMIHVQGYNSASSQPNCLNALLKDVKVVSQCFMTTPTLVRVVDLTTFSRFWSRLRKDFQTMLTAIYNNFQPLGSILMKI